MSTHERKHLKKHLKAGICPTCGSDSCIKCGKTDDGKRQRYQCQSCKRRFTTTTVATEKTQVSGKRGSAAVKGTGATVKHTTMEINPDNGMLEQLSVEETLRREIKRLQRQVKDMTEEAVDTTRLRALIHGVDNVGTPQPPKWLVSKKSVSVHGTPTLFLSDLHWGERVFPSQVNGTNEYSLEIARQRLRRVFESTVRLLRDYLVGGEYDGFVLPLGGDMVSGNIHEELRETNDAQVLTCVADLLENLVAGIDLLANEFGRVFVPCVVGNHGRLDKKPRAKGAVRDNFEWILYHYLAKHFANDDRVTVVVSESLDYMYRVHNTTYLLTHGDQFRGGSGISGPMTPWALGDHRKRKRQDAINKPYDVMIFGHWHQLFWGNGGFLCNGSLKGYDEYAFRNNFPFQAPMQALWVTHPDKGITFQMPVLADKVVKPGQTNWVSIPAPNK